MTARNPASPSDRRIRALLVLLGLALTFLAVSSFLEVRRDWSDPFELSYPNSLQVYNAREFQHGRPLYTDPFTPPHVIAIYGPLAYVVPGILGRWTGADTWSLTKIGRSVSLVFAGATLLLVVSWLALRERAGLAVALLATTLLGTAHLLWPVSFTFRPDTAEMFFELLGVLLFVGWADSRKRFLAVVAFAIAFAFKQSAVAGPAAIVLHLLLSRQFRQALAFAGAVALTTLALVVLFQVATSGMYLVNCYEGLRHNFSPGNVAREFGWRVLSRDGALFGWFVVAGLWTWRERRVDGVAMFFLCALGIGVVTLVRDGSTTHYLLKALAAGGILGGRELARWLARTPAAEPAGDAATSTGPVRRETAFLVLLFVFVALLPRVCEKALNTPTLLEEIAQRPQRDASRLEFLRRTGQELDRLGGPIVFRSGTVGLYSRNLWMLDPYLFTGLAEQGALDDADLLRLLRERRMAAVVSDFRLQPGRVPRFQSTAILRESWVEAMTLAGYVETRAGPLFVYRRP